MILENIRDFDWINDPQNVRFIEEGMLIETLPQTDFWQNSDNHFYKDNGHLFACPQQGDFVLTAVWRFLKAKASAQCGVMFRYNAQNWIKAGLLSPDPAGLQLGSVVARQGASDWAAVNLPENCRRIRLQLKRKDNDFVLKYALDDHENFKQIRMLHLPDIGAEALAGAYACSPANESFECILEELDIRGL